MVAVGHRAAGRYDQAEAVLIKAVACEDAQAISWVMLATIREMNGDLTGSMKAWQSASDLDDSLSEHLRLVDGASNGG
jgi:Tfp pilus assembly protein PilF